MRFFDELGGAWSALHAFCYEDWPYKGNTGLLQYLPAVTAGFDFVSEYECCSEWLLHLLLWAAVWTCVASAGSRWLCCLAWCGACLVSLQGALLFDAASSSAGSALPILDGWISAVGRWCLEVVSPRTGLTAALAAFAFCVGSLCCESLTARCAESFRHRSCFRVLSPLCWMVVCYLVCTCMPCEFLKNPIKMISKAQGAQDRFKKGDLKMGLLRCHDGPGCPAPTAIPVFLDAVDRFRWEGSASDFRVWGSSSFRVCGFSGFTGARRPPAVANSRCCHGHCVLYCWGLVRWMLFVGQALRRVWERWRGKQRWPLRARMVGGRRYRWLRRGWLRRLHERVRLDFAQRHPVTQLDWRGGGGGGAAATRRRRNEKLMMGLQTLLANLDDDDESEADDGEYDEESQAYGDMINDLCLFQQLQALVASKPEDLLGALRNLVFMYTFKGSGKGSPSVKGPPANGDKGDPKGKGVSWGKEGKGKGVRERERGTRGPQRARQLESCSGHLKRNQSRATTAGKPWRGGVSKSSPLQANRLRNRKPGPQIGVANMWCAAWSNLKRPW